MLIKFNKRHGKGGVKEIKVEGDRENEKEVIVRHEIVFSKWRRWNYDKFLRKWNIYYSV